MTIENLSRRDILRGVGLGSGLVLGFHDMRDLRYLCQCVQPERQCIVPLFPPFGIASRTDDATHGSGLVYDCPS